MSGREPSAIRFHEDPGLFREAVNFTAAETAFPARLIEKDYFCSLLLEYLAARDGSLVFKGGTCLAKVYAGFYRLSEDLDFIIPTAVDVSRAERSQRAAGVKEAVSALPARLPGFSVVEPVTGANLSTQYIGVVAYASLLSRQEESIKIEVGLREPLLMPAANHPARTILLDPVSHKPLVAPVSPRCMSKVEAFAEKFRAALSRREVAIRDFYDIDYAVRKLGLQPQDEGMVRLVRKKLDVPGNEPVDVSRERLAALRQQREPQLKPVLREGDFREFDLQRAFRAVVEMAKRLGEHR
ncbi:MAG: nucleotidyl transferase AbiEii/AbiGii toxin family protein [Candidatus Rokubacteria bacterium]|nr:nucleotidyl transferase AbiEii/AbiGii toxin family protein [Candidatus Rokubacteria bacterium]MBI2553127.1 nucleotidyl transferase AbiEii/AbiGii toxin family protein [Candidatus Rokubacteria bacterium]